MSTIVIMPGGFHPFHAGHYELYKSAEEKFPNAEVYVAATNDMSERPFPFQLKEKLAKLAGVEPGHFVQVKSPFQSKEITQHFNPEQDVLIFVRSEKDRNESPKPGGTKKDGTPAYFQPWTGKNLQPFAKHAYFEYLPTVEFGPGITSATQIRNAWPKLDDRRKTAMVMSLYPATQKNPKLAHNVVGMFDQVMSGQLNEFAPGNGDNSLPHAEYVVYQCDPTDQFEFLGRPLYQTDSLPMAHKYAYEMYVKHRPKAFVIYQPHSEASRGNYGVKGQSDGKEVDEGVAEGDENQYRRPTPIEAAKISQQTNAKLNPVTSKFVWKKPNQIGGSFSEQDLVSKGFKKSQYNSWGGTQAMWDRLSSIKEDDMAEARVLFTEPNTKVNVYYNSKNPKYYGKPVQVGKAIPYNKIDAFIDMIVSKYQVKPTEFSWSDIRGDKTDAHIVHESMDYLEEK